MIILVALIALSSIAFILLSFWEIHRIKINENSAIIYAQTIEKMADLICNYTEITCYEQIRNYPVSANLIEHMIFIYRKILKYGDFTFSRVTISNDQPEWFNEDAFIDELRKMSASDDYDSLQIISAYGDITSLILRASRPRSYFIDVLKQSIRKAAAVSMKVLKRSSLPNIRDVVLSKTRPQYLAFVD